MTHKVVRSIPYNFAWAAVGRAVHATSRLGIIVVLAKLSSVSAVGEFALALAVTAPVMKLAELGIQHAQAADVRAEYKFHQYFGLRVTSSLVGLALVLAVALVLSDGHLAGVVIAVGVHKAVAAQSDAFHGLFRKAERMDHVARSFVLRGVATLTLLGVGVAFTGEILVGVAGLIIGTLIVLFGHDFIIGRGVLAEQFGTSPSDARRMWPTWSAQSLRLFRLVAPLGLTGLLISLQAGAPRYFVSTYLGLEALGYLAPILYFAIAGNEIAHALGQAASVRLARSYAARKPDSFLILLSQMAVVGAAMGLLGLAVAVAVGPQILALLYASEYAEYSAVFALVMVGTIFRYAGTALDFGPIAAQRYVFHLVSRAVVLAVVAVGSFLAVQSSSGLLGIAWAIAIGDALHAFMSLGVNVWLVTDLSKWQERPLMQKTEA